MRITKLLRIYIYYLSTVLPQFIYVYYRKSYRFRLKPISDSQKHFNAAYVSSRINPPIIMCIVSTKYAIYSHNRFHQTFCCSIFQTSDRVFFHCIISFVSYDICIISFLHIVTVIILNCFRDTKYTEYSIYAYIKIYAYI